MLRRLVIAALRLDVRPACGLEPAGQRHTSARPIQFLTRLERAFPGQDGWPPR